MFGFWQYWNSFTARWLKQLASKYREFFLLLSVRGLLVEGCVKEHPYILYSTRMGCTMFGRGLVKWTVDLHAAGWLLALWAVMLIFISIDWRILERDLKEWKDLLVLCGLRRKAVAMYYFFFFLEKTSALRSAWDYVRFWKVSHFQRLTALRTGSSLPEGEGKNIPAASLIPWRTTDFILSFEWDDSPLKALSEFSGIKVACKSFI